MIAFIIYSSKEKGEERSSGLGVPSEESRQTSQLNKQIISQVAKEVKLFFNKI